MDGKMNTECLKEDLYIDQILAVEPHGIEPVKDAERHGHPFDGFTFWFAANVVFANLTMGALLVSLFGLSFKQSTVAIVIGTALGVALMAILSTFGPKLGIPQLIQSRRAFGLVGNYFPAAMNWICGVGWFGVNTVLGAFALDWLFHLGLALSIIIMTIICIIFAVYGYNMMHALQKVCSVILTVVFIMVTYFALLHFNVAFPANTHAPYWSTLLGGMILGIGTAFSYIMGWITYSSDYTRYLPKETSSSSVFWNIFLSNFISIVWVEMLGAALATIHSINVPTDLVTNLLPYTLAIFAMLAVVLGTVTANVPSIYSSALSIMAIDVAAIRRIFPYRWAAALAMGILGGALAFAGNSGYYSRFASFLLVMAYWIVPWVSVVVWDYLIVHRGQYGLSPFYGSRNKFYVGFWAWLIGIVVSIPFWNQSLYTGPFAAAHPNLGDLSNLVGFIVAGAIYLIFARQVVNCDK